MLYMKNALFFSSLVFGLFLASCGSSDGPEITLNDPSNGEVYQRGTDMHFDMDVSDESGLASYTIDIHADGLANGWEVNQTWPIEGTSINVHHHELVIPDEVDPGEYHFEVIATDTDGNSSDVHVDIQIQ